MQYARLVRTDSKGEPITLMNDARIMGYVCIASDIVVSESLVRERRIWGCCLKLEKHTMNRYDVLRCWGLRHDDRGGGARRAGDGCVRGAAAAHGSQRGMRAYNRGRN